MRRKNSYVMGKLDIPKRVTLPNGRTFLARCKRVLRSQLPVNITLKGTYRQRAVPKGRRQQGRELLNNNKQNKK